MAERIVSPGVFTRENDQSFIAQGVSQIGAAIIGPTAQGPAFVPTLVNNYNDFTRIFGESDGNSYVPFTVKSYLKNAGRATIVRVLPIDGYESSCTVVGIQMSSSLGVSTSSLFILAPTELSGQSSAIVGSVSAWNSSSLTFNLVVQGEGYSASLDPSSGNYISNIFPSSPKDTSKKVYLYTNFTDSQAALLANRQYLIEAPSSSLITSSLAAGISLTGTETTPAYVESITPWIQSQTINGSKSNLFKFHTLSNSAPQVKISIENLKPWTEMPTGVDYGTFTVTVRAISDEDNRPVVLEQFNNCTLDPTSPNYIARVIGDQYRVFGKDSDGNSKLYVYGDYVNQSKYLYIEMGSGYPKKALPIGMDKYYSPISSASWMVPAIKYVTKQFNSDPSFLNYMYMGFDFTADDNNYVNLPNPGDIQVSGSAFSLENCYMPSGSVAPFSASFVLTSSYSVKARKFTVAFQGGYDGFNTLTPRAMGKTISGSANIMGFNCAANAAGTVAYKKGIDTISNPDDYDINMLLLPGVPENYAGSIITYANLMCESRQDVFFLYDSSGINATVNQAVQQVQTKDSNYAATYYPWVKIYDSANDTYLWAPPSTVMAGVIAFNDKVGAEWWAPAGLNRGGIPDAVQVYTRLTQAERDTLYEGRVNPIATFVGQGIVAWGQKTLQFKSSALDRINVRRLLIALKKYIASTTKYLVFEQNTVATRQRFLNIVNPYMESVQQRQGLYAFKVVMDETNNTPDIIDRNMMVGQIWLQPAKTAEKIVIDFNIMSTGATFGA